MHSVILYTPNNKDSWILHRGVEVIAYQPDFETVQILFLLIAENTLQEKDNSLIMLHRGNVSCAPVPSWPLPMHPNEAGMKNRGVLEQVYGRLFCDQNGGVIFYDFLTPWDEFTSGSKGVRIETVEPFQVKQDIFCHSQLENIAQIQRYAPFSTWTIAPFTRRSFYLLAFSLSFSGETYRRLVSMDDYFTVDGPTRILTRIASEDPIDHCEQGSDPSFDFFSRLNSDHARLDYNAYDLIFLGADYAQGIKPAENYCSHGVFTAPLQPQGTVLRYITMDQGFTLPLQFTEAKTVPKELVTTPTSPLYLRTEFRLS
ncbi:MAG: hypothetical protein JW795_12025 [Chitinivibrionales bacterium]|nr:hypothetical protein [Chitinivibrionales bacterium]